MPEFEESSPQSNPEHTYTPSSDAKPRTRRRSGGFKKEHSSAPKGNMGEVNPTEALKTEKLSGSGKPSDTSDSAPKRERREPRGERPERREPREPRGERPERREPRAERAPRRERTPEPERETNPQPSPETLAAITLVEDRIAARKADRDANHEERKKARAAEKAARPVTEKKPAGNKPKAGSKKPAKKKGLIASILSIFGLGPKEPAKKQGGNRKGGRPQGKGGNRGGQNRQGGNRGGRGGNRSGQNRRRGGQNRRPQGARSE